jgi:hypothetical protein
MEGRHACEYCGAEPAAPVLFISEQRLVILRRLRRRRGVFCRSCGLAIGREMQNTTLITGWWGPISFFWNFTVIARNARRLWRHAQLPVPPPAPHQMSPEPSIWRRSGVRLAAGLVPLALVIGFFVYRQVAPGGTLPQSGQCVTLSSNPLDPSNPPHITGVVDCPAQHDGKVVAPYANGSCPPNSLPFAELTNGVAQSGSVVCVDPTQ